MEGPPWGVALAAGGVAGTATDIALFPLDTIKTRLQSSQGFWAAGGFKRIYSGLGPAALGSAPNAALFFCSYEVSKTRLTDLTGGKNVAGCHMLSASVGEVSACLIRVPVEILKQRRQADSSGKKTLDIFRSTLKNEGFRGFYRGYFTTVMREIPFSLIQFPLWEHLKATWKRNQNAPLAAWQSSLCGALAGGISAAVTTPLDVAKTRIMLAPAGSEEAVRASIPFTLGRIPKRGWFSGVVPRVLWITIGGAIFFGSYEKTKNVLLL